MYRLDVLDDSLVGCVHAEFDRGLEVQCTKVWKEVRTEGSESFMFQVGQSNDMHDNRMFMRLVAS
jgi:hypothetical protein